MATLLGQLHREDEGTVVLQDIGKCSSSDTTLQETSLFNIILWELKILWYLNCTGPYFVWPISSATPCQPLYFIELGWLAYLPKPDLLHISSYMSVGVMSFCSGRGNILFQNCMCNRPASIAGLHVMVLLICGRIIVLHVTDILRLIRYCYICSVTFLKTSMQIHMYFKVGHDPCHVLHQ